MLRYDHDNTIIIFLYAQLRNMNTQFKSSIQADAERISGPEDLPFSEESIEDVDKSTKLAQRKQLPYALYVLLGSILLIWFAWSFGFTNLLVFALFFGAVGPALIWAITNDITQNSIETLFTEQFAKMNGYSYSSRGHLRQTNARRLQTVQHSVGNEISGIYRGYPFRLFTFHPNQEAAIPSDALAFTVGEIDYKTKLPHIFLETHQPSFLKRDLLRMSPSALHASGPEKKLKLEGDFNKYFDFYVPPGLEIEALEIFAPDLMQDLIDRSQLFSLEFVDHYIYIYSRDVIKTKDKLMALN